MGSLDLPHAREESAFARRAQSGAARPPFLRELIVIAVALAVYVGCSFSPPHLMDDVDSVQAQIGQNMLTSGDWVTPRLDGVIYLEKSPLKYWTIAISFAIFGIHDWAARLPLALSAVLLCWLVARMGWWAFRGRAGLYAGLALSTCVGLFLFTRVLIPDVMLTLAIAFAMWSFLRALDDNEPHPRLWAALYAASIGIGLLIKGLIAAVFPIGAAFFYLLFTRQLFSRRAWRRIHPFWGLLLLLAIAAPWHVLATIHNPPYFAWTLHSGPGQYHGFLWFYFINEQLLRFLNLRYPRDYNKVPVGLFWLLHLLWLFPWSAFFPALFKLGYRSTDRASRTRLMCLCWTGVILVFFTFSSTQEYYSMPCYPALALLLGCAMTMDNSWIRGGCKVVGVIAASAAIAVFAIWFSVRNMPVRGDISEALARHPSEYTLSLGHMGDLTLLSFAYLRTPLLLAGLAFLIGAIGLFALRGHKAFFAMAAMMVLFVHAAGIAMIAFDPYLSSQPLAEALVKSKPGTLIIDNPYYEFSSIFFYANRSGLMLNGRRNNLEYGSYAPGAPDVFIGDARFQQLWSGADRYYVAVEKPKVAGLEKLAGAANLFTVRESGGKYLFTNHADWH